MFQQTPENVVIVTDTLASTFEGDPAFFVTKTHILPHFGTVASGTGIYEVHLGWLDAVRANFIALDIDQLASHTPDILRSVDSELSAKEVEASRPWATSTLYLFGWSDRHGQYVRYTFRSTGDYEPEVWLEPCFALKPEPQAGLAALEGLSTFEDWIDLAETVRAEQNALPMHERIHIGGSLMVTVLENKAITTRELYRFADHDDQWLAMNRHHGLIVLGD
jgi:hypothetical protein